MENLKAKKKRPFKMIKHTAENRNQLKHTRFFLPVLLLLLLSLSACRSDEKPVSQDQENNNAQASSGPAEEIPESDGENVEAEAAEENAQTVPVNPINHYYNRGIYEKDGYIYRQQSDGLYRRQRGSASWEQLCRVKIHVGRGLTSYGNRMYFTGCLEASDTEGTGWNNAVFYLDLDTMEWGECILGKTLVSTIAVYDGCLYLQCLNENWLEYEGWRLDKEGNLAEKLDSESEDFLCYEQNRCNTAAYQTMSAEYFPLEDPYGILKESKSEVISLPHCAAMLNGSVILEQRKDESACSYFLRNLKTGEDSFLFDGVDVLFVTEAGIYYFADPDTFQYYSFTEKESREIPLPAFWQTDLTFADEFLTYDENALYFFDPGYTAGLPQILRLSRENWSVEILAQGQDLADTELSRLNQTDGEYFYHGETMYPIEN